MGISTANQTWGPATRYAYLLSNNAAGFPHAFLATAHPMNLYLLRLHGLIQWGILSQSQYSPVGGPRDIESLQFPGTRRFMSGVIVTAEPRGIEGLELGVARFFHEGWPAGGPGRHQFLRPLESCFKIGLKPEPPLSGTTETVDVRENQLASMFARWVLAGSGFEVYGEYGREDHSRNLRDFLEEPDRGGSSRMLGLRKMWKSGLALRAEEITFEAAAVPRFQYEGVVYLHSVLRQGHTYRGQILGADVGVGSGAGSTIAIDRYTESGRVSAFWTRTTGHDIGTYFLDAVDKSAKSDVLHSLGVDVLRFAGPIDFTAKTSLTADLNRNFHSDIYNLNVSIGVRYAGQR